MVYSSEVGLNILEQNTSNIPRPCKKGILVYMGSINQLSIKKKCHAVMWPHFSFYR
jgi:hypothetical protein